MRIRPHRDRCTRPRTTRRQSLPRLEFLEGRVLMASFVVTDPDDSGPGTLRDAIIQANENGHGPDRISFLDGLGPIILSSGQLTITSPLEIAGPVEGLTIERSGSPGTPAFRILDIANPNPGASLDVLLDNLTLAGGDASTGSGAAGAGGGIRARGADLRISNSTVRDNAAAFGGGIAVFRDPASPGNSLTLVACTVSGNAATFDGGGVRFLADSLAVTACTVSGNVANTVGGGLTLGPLSTTTITSSTVQGNAAATRGGGVFANVGSTLTIAAGTVAGNSGYGLSTAGALATLTNTIVAGNTALVPGSDDGDPPAAVPADVDGNGSVAGASNLVGDGSGGLDPATNLLGVDPLLGPLRDNGGPTRTMAPLAGSPAIDAGDDALIPPGVAFDQRGPGFTRTVGRHVDIGAIESTGPTTVTTVASTTVDGAFGAGMTIVVTVGFSRPVVVTGSPQLGLNSSGTAVYASGSGTETLSFSYTVSAGENAEHLDYPGVDALDLAGGTIRDAANADAVLTLPAPGGPGSLGADANLVVDTTAPHVVAYRVRFGSRSYDLIGTSPRVLPWQITGIQVVFSEPIVQGSVSSLSGLPASGLSGLGTATLTWTFNSGLADGQHLTTLLGDGESALRDRAGNGLGGGAGFAQAFDVLFGDSNGNGRVGIADLGAILRQIRRGYDIFDDIDGDGDVDLEDIRIARTRIGHSL